MQVIAAVRQASQALRKHHGLADANACEHRQTAKE